METPKIKLRKNSNGSIVASAIVNGVTEFCTYFTRSTNYVKADFTKKLERIQVNKLSTLNKQLNRTVTYTV